MDIGKSFGYVFEDERWVTKILLGGVIMLIPLLGSIAVLGYMLKVAQNVAQGNPKPLPEWNEFSDHLMRGLHGFLIYLVYFIPYIVLTVVMQGVLLGSSLLERSGSSERSAGALSLGFTCVLVPIMLIVAFASGLLAYAALARYVATNNLSEAFKFSEVIASVRTSFTPWLVLLLVGLLAGFVGGLGIIACFIGVIFTAFYSQCVMGHALGQTVAKLGMGATNYTTNPPSYQ